MGSTEAKHFFDAGNWLGFSLNTLSQAVPSPYTVHDLQNSEALIINKARRAVRLDDATDDRNVGVPTSATYAVPKNVKFSTDDRGFNGKLLTFDSGTDVLHTMNSDASFSASYMGVTVSGGVSYATSNHFTSNSRYAFLSENSASYNAALDDYDGYVNEHLLAKLAALPAWKADDETAKQKYEDFFDLYGTHVIIQAFYGWRYQFQCSESNTSTDSSADFELNCKVKYLDAAEASASYKTSDKYTSFEKNSKAEVRAIGGTAKDAGAVLDNPTDPEAKKAWDAAVGTKPDEGLVAVDITPMDRVIAQMSDDDGTKAPMVQHLGKALFDMSRACKRRLTVTMPDGSAIPSDVKFDMFIVSGNASFVRATGATNLALPTYPIDLQYRDAQGGADIQADSTASVKIKIRFYITKITDLWIDVISRSGADQFFSKYRLSATHALTTGKSETVDTVPTTIMYSHQEGSNSWRWPPYDDTKMVGFRTDPTDAPWIQVYSDEYALNLHPERDFWWPNRA